MPFIHFLFLNYRLINTLSKYIYVHKLHLETGYSFSYLLDSYRGTWSISCQSKKNCSTSKQVRHAFQTSFFSDLHKESQNIVIH